MFALLSILSIVIFPTLGCSDVFFLEKNQITKYVRYSRYRGGTHISTPALDLGIDLEKNGFGKMIYNDKININDVFMLYAYKSSQNLHIYRICPENINEELIIGPIVSDTKIFVGYKIDINDTKRFDKHLADNNFNLFGKDVNALKKEIADERYEQRKKQIAEQRELNEMEWKKKTFIYKISYYFGYFVLLLIITSFFIPRNYN